ncbi:MAG TPA: NlpC/P60 family protein [Chloroflexota bacterium]|nr:NlpC/P60 family protein [Chloroflexota bacterium]
MAVPTLGPTSPTAAAAANAVLTNTVAGAAPALVPLANAAPALGTTTNATAPSQGGQQGGTANIAPLTGAIGSPSGPLPALASTASNTGTTSGSTGPSRVLPNLPASPNQARLVAIAQSLVGSRYTWAGTSPATGFDCSGFVYYVYNTYGYPLERTMAEQFAAGRRVRMDELRPGDIVFFADTYTPGLSHNGIYIGDGKFIHAVDESVGVAITPLNTPYWEQRYVGAVRIID